VGLLLLSALAGLFANGPLSWGKAQDPQGLLEIEYEPFQRHTAPGQFTIHLAPQAAFGNTVPLHLNAELLNAIKVERITPEPEQARPLSTASSTRLQSPGRVSAPVCASCSPGSRSGSSMARWGSPPVLLPASGSSSTPDRRAAPWTPF
jgi:hypothetical protein